eukprot:c5145_g1_i1.p2 GENE.c5145_g1_i1~~c5145_g1_i1.p2  ORF type:complete len:225 (+),score=39.09 c5145_g1_i1:32-706(+)
MKALSALLLVTLALVHAQTGEEAVSDPGAIVAAESAAVPPPTPDEAAEGVSTQFNSAAPAVRGAQSEGGDSSGKDMVCVCKRIKKPQNVKCNRTVEVEEPPQDPKTLKELVQCTPGGYNLTQAQRLLLRQEARERQEMEAAQAKFEEDQVKLMNTCLSGHCKPEHDLNSETFWTAPAPIDPIHCYDRCHDNNCRPIWKSDKLGWEDWFACVQQCVGGCYVIVDH